MTHTLIATNTLDACIHICAPPPPPASIHTVLREHMHNTTHNIRCQRVGTVGQRPTTSTSQTPRECRAINPPPPPFHVVVWVVGLLGSLCLRLGRVFIAFLQVCFCFLNWVNSEWN